MKKEITNIQDIINLIDVHNISDLSTVNSICKASLGIGFFPIQIIGKPRPKTYFIQGLQACQKRVDKGLELPFFLGANVPFKITDIFNN